jgi:hypothetical protein
LEVLLESDEDEDDRELIAPVMSSFFDVFKEEGPDTTCWRKAGPDGGELKQTAAAMTPFGSHRSQRQGSSKSVLVEEKGKGHTEIEEDKKSIEDDTPLSEGPFDQVLCGWRYRVHHAVGKVMGVKQLAEAVAFTKQLGYPLGSMMFGAGMMIIYTTAQTTWT